VQTAKSMNPERFSSISREARQEREGGQAESDLIDATVFDRTEQCPLSVVQQGFNLFVIRGFRVIRGQSNEWFRLG
jgi:hypothetical protein